jgi:hypothetical protein
VFALFASNPVGAALALLALFLFGLVFQPKYASATTVTITLASLASASYRQSAVVDNSTNLYEDVILSFKFKTAASAAGTVSFYAYGTADGGSTYSDNASGSDAAFTPSNVANLRLIATFQVTASTQYTGEGPYLLSAVFGTARIPQKWGIICLNSSGQALDSTGGNHQVNMTGVNSQA